MTAREMLVPLRPAMDETWYPMMRQAAPTANALYMVLGPGEARRQELRRQFDAGGQQANPDLRPDGAALQMLIAEEAALHDLANRIETEEPQRIVREAYAARIEELLANINMYRSACTDDTAGFKRANERVYGKPDVAVHTAVIGLIRVIAESDDCDASREILSLLPAVATAEHPVELRPEVGLFERIWALHGGPDGFFEHLFNGDVPAAGTIVTRAEGDRCIANMLRSLHADHYSLSETTTGYWGVMHDEGHILCPKEYALTAEAFVAIVGHEVGSHLLERLNGERQPLRLLSFGLAGYERGNEGRALVREQVAYPAWEAYARTGRWAEILCRHLAISLAAGINGRTWDFVATYRLVRAIFELWNRAWPASSDVSPDDKAWQVVARALKGTDGTGGAYYKDQIYLEGNVACWGLARQNPAIILMGDLGKFDIADPHHRALVAEQALEPVSGNGAGAGRRAL